MPVWLVLVKETIYDCWRREPATSWALGPRDRCHFWVGGLGLAGEESGGALAIAWYPIQGVESGRRERPG